MNIIRIVNLTYNQDELSDFYIVDFKLFYELYTSLHVSFHITILVFQHFTYIRLRDKLLLGSFD